MATGKRGLVWQCIGMDKLLRKAGRAPAARTSFNQLVRFAVVGALSNLLGYALYLLITNFGASPKIAVSFLYPIGAAIGFWGNRHITFDHQGNIMSVGLRYLLAHCVGFLINWMILEVFTYQQGFAHQWVQACAIFIVAIYLFLVCKYLVFPDKSSSDKAMP